MRPAACPTLAGLALFAACAGPPPPTGEGQVPSPARTTHLAVFIHGAKNDAGTWATGFVEALRPALAHPDAWTLVAYDWAEGASANATTNAKREGEALRARLAEAGYQHVHLVGHSVGAFVVDAATPRDARPYTLHASYWDPFVLDGLDFEWGARRFGVGADFAEQVLVTSDGVPWTVRPFAQAHVFDVTRTVPRDVKGDDGHWWPPTLVARRLREAPERGGAGHWAEVAGTLRTDLASAFPRGARTDVAE